MRLKEVCALDDIILQIKADISTYQKQEEIARAKRETLESLLRKLESPHKETSTPPRTPRQVSRSGLSKQLGEIAFQIMSDGRVWPFGELWEAVNREIGRQVAASTLRFALKQDARINKPEYGKFQAKIQSA